MAEGLLSSFGQGLQNAGEVLSPQVYEKNAIERRDALVNVARGLEIAKAQRSLAADQKFQEAVKGLKPGMTSSAMLEAVSKVDPSILAESPSAQQFLQFTSQIHSREVAQEQKREQMVFKYDQLQQQRDLAEQRSTDARLSAEERARHNLEMERLNGAIAQMRADATKQNIELRRDLQQQNQDRYKAGLLEPDEATFMAKQAWTGDTSVFNNLGRGRQGAENIKLVRKAIMEEGKRLNKTPEELAAKNVEFFGIKAGERSLGTRQANVDMAVNEALNLVPLALDASEKLSRTNIKSVNALVQYAQDKTASPELRRLAGATNALINVYARAVSPSGVPTVSDKDHAREVLDKGFSDGDYKAAADQLVKEMYAAKKSPGQVRDDLRNTVTGGEGDKGKPGAKVLKFDEKGNLVQ